MTKEEFAQMITGRYRGDETTATEKVIARENGLVVMYGYSDDNVEIEGAIRDEVSAYDGTTISFLNGEILANKCEDENCPYFKGLKNNSNIKKIEALWCGEENYSWTFKTDISHATFEVVDDDGEKFCRGIVFDINSIKGE
jgi:hypothetical protein